MAKQIVDKSQIIIPKGTMEDFNRPNHADFKDSSELRKDSFSGIRHNSITDSIEIWLLGRMEKSVGFNEVQLDPLAVNKAYADVFCLEEIAPDTEEMRGWNRMIGKNG